MDSAILLRYLPQISDTPEAVHIAILVEEMSCVVWLSICIGIVRANVLHTSSSPGFVHGKLERGVNYRIPSCVTPATR